MMPSLTERVQRLEEETRRLYADLRKANEREHVVAMSAKQLDPSVRGLVLRGYDYSNSGSEWPIQSIDHGLRRAEALLCDGYPHTYRIYLGEQVLMDERAIAAWFDARRAFELYSGKRVYQQPRGALMSELPVRVQQEVNRWARVRGGYPTIVELGRFEVGELADLWMKTGGADRPAPGQMQLLGMWVQPVDEASHLRVRNAQEPAE